MDSIIQINNLVRDYEVTEGIIKKKKRTVKALNGISFDVNKGEIFGLLGPNGAGKTTTIKILTTLLLPTTGQVKIFGQDVVANAKAIRPRINFIFGGERSLYWRLSAEDNLRYFADLYEIDPQIQKTRIPALLELVGLTDRARTKVETYSKGMKQRLHIARGLINDPEIIFLDEPTIGLDPEVSHSIRHLIGRLKAAGKTIMLTTHYMFEADQLCDNIGIINQGKIIALGHPSELKKLTHGLTSIELRIYGLNELVYQELKAILSNDVVNLFSIDQQQHIRIQTENAETILNQVISFLDRNNVKILNVTTRDASLEDAYLKLLGRVV